MVQISLSDKYLGMMVYSKQTAKFQMYREILAFIIYICTDDPVFLGGGVLFCFFQDIPDTFFRAYRIRISENYTGASKTDLTHPYPSLGKDKN